ncbi:MAG: hypothetical protein ACRC9S_00660 [Vibrio sp.]
MKVSELKMILNQLSDVVDPEVVMGEVWLPERLLAAQLDASMLFLTFDNAPDEDEGEEEGRGFVEHELELIQAQVLQILGTQSGLDQQAAALVKLITQAHETTSAQFIEILNPSQV